MSQGRELFREFDLSLFRAFFDDCQDISDRYVLVDVAHRSGLDVDQFRRELDSGRQKPVVMAEFIQCLSQYRSYAQGVPLVVFNNSPPLVGCPPLEVYRTAITRQLEPYGM